MRVGGTGHSALQVYDAPRLLEALARQESGRAIIPIGGGTNTYFADTNLDATFVRIGDSRIRMWHAGPDLVDVVAGAGAGWDELVELTVREGLHGIEHLSAIPGTVGAAPVNNVGALGHDLAEVLTYVIAVDRLSRRVRRINRDQCGFGYRQSIFLSWPKRFIVTRVALRLRRSPVGEVKALPALTSYLDGLPRLVPLVRIREAIIASRRARITDPAIRPNCGSFFVNPWLKESQVARLLARWPQLPTVEDGDGRRLRAGWMLERAGAKNLRIGGAAVDLQNALILVNSDNATFSDVTNLARQLKHRVRAKFGVALRQEPTAVEPSAMGGWR